MAEKLTGNGYWVRLTRANGDQTLWCVNTGRDRARAIYRREVRKAEVGDEVEWGEGQQAVTSCVRAT